MDDLRVILDPLPFSLPILFDGNVRSGWGDYPDLSIHTQKRENLLGLAGVKPDLIFEIFQPVHKGVSFIGLTRSCGPEYEQVISMFTKKLVIESAAYSGEDEGSLERVKFIQELTRDSYSP
jgi:hypothetical protein